MKHAIIVGGSRGIGFAIARNFMDHNTSVTLVSRNKDILIKSANTLQDYALTNKIDANVTYNVCDISKEDDIIGCLKKIVSFCSQNNASIDVLVNSAGITYSKLLLATSSESMKKVLDTNLVGTMLFSKLITKHMIKQKHGSIINIGSIVGLNGNVGQTVYSASKAALEGFTKSLAKELAPKGIAVNLISPGFIDTDMTSESLSVDQLDKIKSIIPMRRIGSADEVANVAYFLASSSYITGHNFIVDGGLKLTF